MGEESSINLIKVKNGESKTLSGKVINTQTIEDGGEKKRKVTIEFGNSFGKKNINLVEKEPAVFDENQKIETSKAKDFYMKWKMLKDAGLPVPNTVRITSDKTVAITDLTVNGSELYGKSDGEKVIFEEYLKPENHRKSKNLDGLFLSVKSDEIFAEANRIATIATENNICLPFDDPLIMIVHPDGTWSLIILDLGDARKGPHPDPDLKPTLREQNEWLISKFFDDIKLIREKIQKTQAR
jgi:hypothetical protein